MSKFTKPTQRQKIAYNALMACGHIDKVEYNEDGTVYVEWEDGNYGSPIEYIIERNGEIL